MYNDYSGKQLHDARYQDWLKEAEGGQRLQAAEASERASRRRAWIILAIGAVIVALALAAFYLL
jgi:uncharacterized iron-regulated membrane protein